jgi:hypothetical protein
MQQFHMQAADIDCFVTHALTPPPAADAGGTYVWSTSQLNGFAKTCKIDLSKLWYVTD